MRNKSSIAALLLVALSLGAGNVRADDANSGFLTDYSLLQSSRLTSLTQYYLAPDASETLKSYTSIMVDQPEIFLSADSPYRGIKPAHMNIIAEVFRDAISQALSENYTIVEQAGPDTLYLKTALTDVSITKKRVKILGFTPAGLVLKAGRSAVQSDYKNAVQHISLVDLKIEGEIVDSQTNSLVAEFVDDHSNSTTPQNWDELLEAMQHFGEVIQCQLANARAEPDSRVNCRSDRSAS